jgi:hypothetical protein
MVVNAMQSATTKDETAAAEAKLRAILGETAGKTECVSPSYAPQYHDFMRVNCCFSRRGGGDGVMTACSMLHPLPYVGSIPLLTHTPFPPLSCECSPHNCLRRIWRGIRTQDDQPLRQA